MTIIFMQEPSHPVKHTWRNPLPPVDDPYGDFTAREVQSMDQDHKEKHRCWAEDPQ